MSERLIQDPDAVAALAATVSDRAGIPAEHVEKDFWVTEVLRGVVKAAQNLRVEVVFKGGTSLSKAHRLIERFSEDVDVLVVLPEPDRAGPSDGVLKSLVQGAVEATGLPAQSVPGATSKGVKRGARFHYREGATPSSAITNGVFLELGSRGGAMPADTLAVSSLLSEHAVTEMGDAPEVAPVPVRVMHPSRTLVEKLVLLHTAHCAKESYVAERAARHYYDVYQLLRRGDVCSAVRGVGITTLARDVCTYSTAAGMPAEQRPAKGGFAASPAFTGGPHVAAAQAAYEGQVLTGLLWPRANRPSFQECVAAVQEAAAIL